MRNKLDDLDLQKKTILSDIDGLNDKLRISTLDKDKIIRYLEHFKGVDDFSYEEKKKALRALVKRITVKPSEVKFEFVVNIIGRGEPMYIVSTLLLYKRPQTERHHFL